MRWSLFCLLLLVGCGEAANMPGLPIGSRCSRDSQCGTPSFNCATRYPGGYCEHPCDTDGDCPMDSFCVLPAGPSANRRACRRRCASDDECRAAEGYRCIKSSANVSVCEVPSPLSGG